MQPATAQPANDNCANATVLSENMEVCTTMDNSTTAEPAETYDLVCANSAQDKSVWFSFVASSANTSIGIYQNTNESITQSKWAIAVYQGTTAICYPAGTSAINCVTASTVNGNDGVMLLQFSNLIVGQTYLIQMTYKPGNSPAPDFCIKYGATSSCGTCSNPCGTACVYTSVPSQTTVLNTCTPYKPSPLLEGSQTTTQCFNFTANKETMNAGLLVGNALNSVCSSASWNWQLFNPACSLLQSGTSNSAVLGSTASPLTWGQTYKICYSVTAPSNCFATNFYSYVYPNSALPIELSSFTALQQGVLVRLDWTTESEMNTDHFVAQRSEDGTNFVDLGTINAQGTSTTKHNYNYADHSPTAGINYYRLKQVDLGADVESFTSSGEDGKIFYSDIVAVDFSPIEFFQFDLTAEAATVKLLQEGQAYVVVFDERGVVVYSDVVMAPYNISISTKDKNGIWYACLLQNGHKQLMRAF